MPVNYPKVAPGDVQNFARAWDMGGLKMILDRTSLQFAVDFANTALRSYVNDLIENAQKLKAAKAAAQETGQNENTTPAPAAAPQKSTIILTD
jgi:hypothetical protein